MGDLMTQYGSFYTNTERQVGNWRAHMHLAYTQETDKKVEVLRATNVKCNLPPNTGVGLLKKEQAREFKTNAPTLLDRFKAKSSRWTDRYHK